jgi:hypothetical protein
LAGLGLGTGASAIVTAIINSNSGKGKSRADAADILIGAAERVGKLNEDLHAQVAGLKDTIDDIQSAMFAYLAEEISREELLKRVKELRR